MGINRYICAFFVLFISACSTSTNPDEHIARAGTLRDAGDLAGAILEFKNALQLDPDNPSARSELGLIYISLGDFASALKELERARQLGGKNDKVSREITHANIMLGNHDEAATELALNAEFDQYEWRYLQALLDLRVGRFEEAKEGFTKLVEERSDYLLVRRGLVSALLQLGQIEDAKDALQAALQASPDDAHIWIMKGELDVSENDFDSAITAYQKALALEANNYAAQVGLAVALTGIARYDEALQRLDGLPEMSRGDLRVAYLRGVIAEGKGNPVLAMRHYREVLQTSPNHRNALHKMSALHFQAGEMSRAIDYLKQLTALYPQEEAYRKQLGAAQLAAGRLDNAFEELSDLDIDITAQTDANMLALLGAAYAKQGQFSEGKASLIRAYELAPESTPIATQLALSHLRVKEYAQAIDLLDAVLAREPDNKTAKVLKILSFLDSEPDKGRRLLDEYIAAEPDSPLPLNIRGFMSLQKKDHIAARNDFQKSIAIDKRFLPPYFNLARLERAEGKTAAMREQLQRILEIEPHNVQALVALGEDARLNDDIESALKYWEQARHNDPDAGAPRVALANHYRQSGELVKAKALIDEAYAVEPYQPLIQYEYAQIQLLQGNTDDAHAVVEKLAQRFPGSARVVELQIALYRLQENEFELRKALNKAIEIAPTAVKPYRMLVSSLLRDDQFDEAKKVADRLSGIENRQADGDQLYGDIALAEGKDDEALSRYRTAFGVAPSGELVLKLDRLERMAGIDNNRLSDWLAQHPNDRLVGFQQAANTHAKGDVTAALQSFEDIHKSNPDNPIVLNNLAWIYHETNDPRALEYAEKANSLKPDSPEIMDTYAWILFDSGKIEQALKLLSRAIEMSPDNPDIRFHYASALAEVGQEQLAIAALLTALGDGKRQFATMAEAKALLQTLQSGS